MFHVRERCSCGAEFEMHSDLTKTKDPDPLAIDQRVREWRSKHKHAEKAKKDD